MRNNEDVAHKEKLGMLLMVAALRNQLSRVKELIVQGAPVDCMNAAGWTPLSNGASRGHVDIVRVLLQAKASVKKDFWPPLFLTINSPAMNYRYGGTDDEYLGVIRLLMQAGAASDYRAANGRCLDAVSRAKDKFLVAVPVIEEELEKRANRLCIDALMRDPGLLLLYVQEPGLVKLVSDYIAMRFDDGTYLGFKSSCMKVAHRE